MACTHVMGDKHRGPDKFLAVRGNEYGWYGASAAAATQAFDSVLKSLAWSKVAPLGEVKLAQFWQQLSSIRQVFYEHDSCRLTFGLTDAASELARLRRPGASRRPVETIVRGGDGR